MISKYAGIILGFGAGEIIILFIKVFLTFKLEKYGYWYIFSVKPYNV